MSRESVPVSKAGFRNSVGRSPLDAYGRSDRLKRPGLHADQARWTLPEKRLHRTPVKTTAAAARGRSRNAPMTQAEVSILYPYKCLKFMSK